MSTQRKTSPAARARAFAARVAVSLAGLERSIGGLSPLEEAEAERIRHACQRLVECAEELTRSALVVAGSMKQARVHPLVRTEQELRKEIADGLRKLHWYASQRAMCDRINALVREREAPRPQPPPRKPRPKGKP